MMWSLCNQKYYQGRTDPGGPENGAKWKEELGCHKPSLVLLNYWLRLNYYTITLD